LAGRGADFAARAELIAALRLIAQGLDTEDRTTIHGKALGAGLTALKEADDFLPSGTRLETDLDLPGLVAKHVTPALKESDPAALTSLSALKTYFTYAQEQLARSVDKEVAGSMALHALGKLHEDMANGKGIDIKAAAPKAMVYYQASLIVFPENYMAANDLGVLLARNNHFEGACRLLEYSFSLCRQSSICHNLAVVYDHLGRGDLARQTEQQAAYLRQGEQQRRRQLFAGSSDQVLWVDENAFAQNNAPASNLPQMTPMVPAAPAVQQAAAAPKPPSPAHQPSGNPSLPVMRPAGVNMATKTATDSRK
jgi:hypothetical protein